MTTQKMYQPMLWQSYSIQDKIDFLFEWVGCLPKQAGDYAYRPFTDLPAKIREAIENLENFEE